MSELSATQKQLAHERRTVQHQAQRIKELEAIIEEAEHHLLNIPMNLDDLDGIDKAIVTLNRGRDDG